MTGMCTYNQVTATSHIPICKMSGSYQCGMLFNVWGICGCRGVVRLFNAVAKAQKMQKAAAEGPKRQVAAISKASFLAELQGQAMKSQVCLFWDSINSTLIIDLCRACSCIMLCGIHENARDSQRY